MKQVYSIKKREIIMLKIKNVKNSVMCYHSVLILKIISKEKYFSIAFVSRDSSGSYICLPFFSPNSLYFHRHFNNPLFIKNTISVALVLLWRNSKEKKKKKKSRGKDT